MVARVDAVVDFLRRLPDEEETASDQDHILPGKAVAEGFEDGLGQLYDPGDGAEQGQAHDKRETDSDAPGANAVFRRQLIGED